MSNEPDKAKPDGKTASDAASSVNPPVKPVENFDLGKVEKDRRIFQNGDTDRTADEIDR
ncbi:MAG TPA: hypothetical protein VHG11_09755 [Pseudorhizobium sp.]|nr:hypothetical protein [Pseudorhizobium sp.]